MGRNAWIQLDNLYSSVRVSGVGTHALAGKHVDVIQFPAEIGTKLPAPCPSPKGFHKYPVKACSPSQSLNTWVFCCHGGPGDLPLSLLSVLPTVFEEQAQYSRQAHYPLQYHINEQQTLRNDGCVQTVNSLSWKQTPQDNAAPVLFHKDAWLACCRMLEYRSCWCILTWSLLHMELPLLDPHQPELFTATPGSAGAAGELCWQPCWEAGAWRLSATSLSCRESRHQTGGRAMELVLTTSMNGVLEVASKEKCRSGWALPLLLPLDLVLKCFTAQSFCFPFPPSYELINRSAMGCL